MRAPRLVVVENLAIVAAHALGEDDLALADRAPFASLLAECALTALGPTPHLEHGQRREQAERGAERAKEPAVEIADEHARDEQHAEHRPEHRSSLAREHPERLDVAIEPNLARHEVVADGREQNSVLDVACTPLERD